MYSGFFSLALDCNQNVCFSIVGAQCLLCFGTALAHVPPHLHFSQLYNMIMKSALVLKIHCVCAKMRHFMSDYFIPQNERRE